MELNRSYSPWKFVDPPPINTPGKKQLGVGHVFVLCHQRKDLERSVMARIYVCINVYIHIYIYIYTYIACQYAVLYSDFPLPWMTIKVYICPCNILLGSVKVYPNHLTMRLDTLGTKRYPGIAGCSHPFSTILINNSIHLGRLVNYPMCCCFTCVSIRRFFTMFAVFL